MVELEGQVKINKMSLSIIQVGRSTEVQVKINKMSFSIFQVGRGTEIKVKINKMSLSIIEVGRGTEVQGAPANESSYNQGNSVTEAQGVPIKSLFL